MSLINYSYFFFGVGNTFVVFTLILFSHKINIFIRPKHESVVSGNGKREESEEGNGRKEENFRMKKTIAK